MKRHVWLLILALGCGDDEYPPEDCEPPLPARDDDGEPWPTYTEASAELEQCSGDLGLARRSGSCADGKRFIALDGGFGGDTYYFQDQALVGLLRYSDVVFSCAEYRFGDAGCDEVDSRAIECPAP